MITCQEKALEHLKMGLFDVLPSGSLDGLTSEDLRLLLNGVSYFLFERGNKMQLNIYKSAKCQPWWAFEALGSVFIPYRPWLRLGPT
jgi:hypothetical protein